MARDHIAELAARPVAEPCDAAEADRIVAELEAALFPVAMVAQAVQQQQANAGGGVELRADVAADNARAAWGGRTIQEAGRHGGIWYGYQGDDYVRTFWTHAEALAWRNAPVMVQQQCQQQQARHVDLSGIFTYRGTDVRVHSAYKSRERAIEATESAFAAGDLCRGGYVDTALFRGVWCILERA